MCKVQRTLLWYSFIALMQNSHGMQSILDKHKFNARGFEISFEPGVQRVDALPPVLGFYSDGYPEYFAFTRIDLHAPMSIQYVPDILSGAVAKAWRMTSQDLIAGIRAHTLGRRVHLRINIFDPLKIEYKIYNIVLHHWLMALRKLIYTQAHMLMGIFHPVGINNNVPGGISLNQLAPTDVNIHAPELHFSPNNARFVFNPGYSLGAFWFCVLAPDNSAAVITYNIVYLNQGNDVLLAAAQRAQNCRQLLDNLQNVNQNYAEPNKGVLEGAISTITCLLIGKESMPSLLTPEEMQKLTDDMVLNLNRLGQALTQMKTALLLPRRPLPLLPIRRAP